MALTANLLADPSVLGARLAARSGHYSARFQYFASKATGVLGLPHRADSTPIALGPEFGVTTRSGAKLIEDLGDRRHLPSLRSARFPSPNIDACVR